MSRLPTPNLVPSAVLPPRTVLRKIMLHLPRQGYPIGSTAASPGGLVTAALAPVFFARALFRPRSMHVRVAFRVGSYLAIWILYGSASK
jgi:hypothetical protein